MDELAQDDSGLARQLLLDTNNSGHVNAAIGSPKFRMVVAPFSRTELFFGAGSGERQRMQRAEPADKVEQKLAVGLGKGQISEFVQDDEVHPSEMLGKPVRPF